MTTPLSSILDDIANDPVPALEVTSSDSSNGLTCLEHLVCIPVLLKRAKDIDAALHTQRLLKIALQSGALSKATALEVFAMLPVASDDAMLLTTASTQHNHKLVEKAAANAFSNPEEAGSLVTDVLEMVRKTVESSKDLSALCSRYCYEIQGHLERLNTQPPMIINGTTSINLLTAEAWLIANIDSYTLNYTPYEGVLDAKFRAITTHAAIKGLLEDSSVFALNQGMPSLSVLAMYLCSKGTIILDQGQALVKTQERLKDYLAGQCKDELNDTGVSHVLDILSQIKEHEKLFIGESSFASVVLDCLATLV